VGSYLSHLARIGDEMATGLGGLFADTFPEVPTLDQIEVGYTFSKKDAAHLAASLDVPAVPLVDFRLACIGCACTGSRARAHHDSFI
jgi:hypothetical protein